jgi:hypothetical protein
MKTPPRTPKKGVAAATSGRKAEEAKVAAEATEKAEEESVQSTEDESVAPSVAAAVPPVQTVTEEFTGTIPWKVPKLKEAEPQPISPPQRVYVLPGTHGSLLDEPPFPPKGHPPAQPKVEEEEPMPPLTAKVALEQILTKFEVGSAEYHQVILHACEALVQAMQAKPMSEQHPIYRQGTELMRQDIGWQSDMTRECIMRQTCPLPWG